MNINTRRRTLFVCRAAIIAALYVVLTFLARMFGLDSNVIQVRFSEMLCVLPALTAAAIPGVTVGCLLSNFLLGCLWQDIVFGTLATLIGAVGTYAMKKVKWLCPLPPIIANTLIVPFVLAYAYHAEGTIPFFMLTVGIGEIISVYILGMILFFALNKYRKQLFD